MNIVKFSIEDNKLHKTDIEQAIIQENTDTLFQFEIPDDWENYRLYCLIKTSHVDSQTFRLPIENTSEGFLAEVPPLIGEAFIKLSVYGVGDFEKVSTNELILATDRGGYIEYKAPCHHDKYPHQGRYHHHHEFPHGFHPKKTRHPYHPHLGSPKSPWGDSYRPIHRGKFGRHGEFSHHHHDCHHPRHRPPIHYSLTNGGKYNPPMDAFDFILSELKDAINNFRVDGKKCYAYHDNELVQIIPLPDFVTQEELYNFFGDVVDGIYLDEETGELTYTIKTIGSDD